MLSEITGLNDVIVTVPTREVPQSNARRKQISNAQKQRTIVLL